MTVDGQRSDLDGAAGVDLNYGAAKGLQLTATLPVAFEDVTGTGWRSGPGDVELGAKYRFINDEQRGWQAAIFPRVILPTGDRHLGSPRIRLLLPLWLRKDFGKTSLFGGGGYEINPGSGNRDFWQAGIAATHDFSELLAVGVRLPGSQRILAMGAAVPASISGSSTSWVVLTRCCLPADRAFQAGRPVIIPTRRWR